MVQRLAPPTLALSLLFGACSSPKEECHVFVATIEQDVQRCEENLGLDPDNVVEYFGIDLVPERFEQIDDIVRVSFPLTSTDDDSFFFQSVSGVSGPGVDEAGFAYLACDSAASFSVPEGCAFSAGDECEHLLCINSTGQHVPCIDIPPADRGSNSIVGISVSGECREIKAESESPNFLECLDNTRAGC